MRTNSSMDSGKAAIAGASCASAPIPKPKQSLLELHQKLKKAIFLTLGDVDPKHYSSLNREWLAAEKAASDLDDLIFNLGVAKRLAKSHAEYVLGGKSLRPLRDELRRRVAVEEAAWDRWRECRMAAAKRIHVARRCLTILLTIEPKLRDLANTLAHLEPESIPADKILFFDYEGGKLQAEIERIEGLFGGLGTEINRLSMQEEGSDAAA